MNTRVDRECFISIPYAFLRTEKDDMNLQQNVSKLLSSPRHFKICDQTFEHFEKISIQDYFLREDNVNLLSCFKPMGDWYYTGHSKIWDKPFERFLKNPYPRLFPTRRKRELIEWFPIGDWLYTGHSKNWNKPLNILKKNLYPSLFSSRRIA